jgi:hypothetical protein
LLIAFAGAGLVVFVWAASAALAVVPAGFMQN